MRRRHLVPSALAILSSACASMMAAEARQDYIANELAHVEYREACITLWPRVVKLLAAKGFGLYGEDRAVVGEPPQNSFEQTMSPGFQTRGTGGGSLEVGTNWNDRWTRYVATGTAVGAAACQVTFNRIWKDQVDPAAVHSAVDSNMAMDLLRSVDPAEAARIEASAPKGS
ncbi:MAG TPA: hypothetical protein VMT17_13990 [Anaeromyxobacteraceae bacterium]|nr:hypothetical protein [Anaeromyxobacteraceae bacterium]